jgi:hypothetical protein
MFKHWLRSSAPGESLIYYRGFYPRDIERPSAHRSSEDEKDFRSAWEAAEKRQCVLTQRKLGLFDYEYIATKSRFA